MIATSVTVEISDNDNYDETGYITGNAIDFRPRLSALIYFI